MAAGVGFFWRHGRTEMAATSFEHEGEARAALHAIVSDPAYGPDALSSVKTLSNLLQDFLPDAPRETGLLIAAASAGLPDKLRQHVGQGLDQATAIKLVSGYLATRTAFTEAACTWVATELANALRVPSPEDAAAPRQPQIPTEVVPVPQGTAPAPGDGAQRQPAADATLAADPAVAAELAAWHQMADRAGGAGNPAAARDQYAALLRVRERVLGPEHPDTLSTRHNLASWTGEAGNPAAARDLYAELLPVRERVLGAEHPATLSTRHNLARWTGEAGDPAAARDLYAELLPIRERVVGPLDPATLNTRASLAYWKKKSKKQSRPRGKS
jgi:hypothetical protein